MTYSNGYITVPKGGLYYIYAQVNCNPNSNSWCGFDIRVNGKSVCQQHYSQFGSGLDVLDSQTSQSGLLRKLSTGDRLWVIARNTGYYNINRQSFLGAVLLS